MADECPHLLVLAPLEGRSADSPVNLLVMLGRRADDAAVEAARVRWRFATAAADKDGALQVTLLTKGETRRYSPQHLLSLVLAQLRADAEAFCGGPAKDVCLAVPVHFDADAAAALKEAAQMAGMRVKQARARRAEIAPRPRRDRDEIAR